MKKIVIAMCLVMLPVLSLSQQKIQPSPDCSFNFQFAVIASVITAPTRVPVAQGDTSLVGYDNRVSPCETWRIYYQTEGVTASSIELQQAPVLNGSAGSWVTWSNPQTGTTFPLTTSGASGVGQGTGVMYQPFVAIKINSATGTGVVYGRVEGWKAIGVPQN